jgi:hypothetical protein
MLTQDLRLCIEATPLYCDNISTVLLAKDPISSDRATLKFVTREVKELVAFKDMEFMWVPTYVQAGSSHTH